MRTRRWIAIVVFAALFAASGHGAAAAGPKTYQVTGPVLEVSDTMIVVKKGNDRWEVGRDAATKIEGDLKVGETVTIQYRMVAATVQVKSTKPASTAPKPKKS
jgi:hypothetical protein